LRTILWYIYSFHIIASAIKIIIGDRIGVGGEGEVLQGGRNFTPPPFHHHLMMKINPVSEVSCLENLRCWAVYI
jgi:hypothetical protein